MAKNRKHDLRDQVKPKPGVTPTNTDVEFAGDENRTVMPSSGRLVTPDPGNVVEGQTSKM
ncbi:MAG TPA: hypothetical protein VJ798_09195 [Rhizomicrobium sp.]|nr:hypothetical protein [Rhizomicrobium sp.]